MKVDVNFGREIMIEVEVEAVVNPGYPPPPCQDPSSPAFSDCGDPGDVEELHVFMEYKHYRTGKVHRIEITDFLDSDTEDELSEQAFEELGNCDD